jgi:head-tail adaptor
MKRTVTLERLTVTRSPDSGEEVGTWDALGAPLADVTPLDGMTRFVFRCRSAWGDLGAQDRIRLDGRAYDLRSVVRFEFWGGIEAVGVAR